MFFDSWQGILRVVTVAPLAYMALVVALRVSGKRTLSKMSAFDLVVTVALGSTLATIILSKDVALVEGIVAFGVLILLQFVIAWSSTRSTWIRDIVKSEPSLLLYNGQMLVQALREQRVTAGEVRAAIRAQGIGQVEAVDAVILENDGSFSVIVKGAHPPTAVLQDVRAYPPPRHRPVDVD